MIEYLTILVHARKAKMDERGASAVEYGLLVAGIAAAHRRRRLPARRPDHESAFSDTCASIAGKGTAGTLLLTNHVTQRGPGRRDPGPSDVRADSAK